MRNWIKKIYGFPIIILMMTAYGLTGCGGVKDATLIEATGTVEMTEITVSSKVGGEIAVVNRQEGTRVRKRDLLAVIDGEDLAVRINAAKANLDSARLYYENADRAITRIDPRSSAGIREARVQLAENNLLAAEAGFTQAEKDLARAGELYQAQVISKAEFEQAQTGAKVSRAQYQAAQEQVNAARTSPSLDDLATVKKQALAQIKQAEANLSLLETNLKNLRITAPASGVVSVKTVEPGEIVSAGTALFTILDYAKPWVKIYLPLKQMQRVKLNQTATVKIDVFPDREYRGRVSFIAMEAEFTPKDYQTKEERVKQVFAVKVALNNQDGVFKAGMPVDVFIKTKN